MGKEHNLPTMEELTDFLNKQSGEVNKREIARHFKIKGDDRAYLKHLLSEIEHQGLIIRKGKSFTTKGHLPERISVEITGIDNDGELVGRPVVWNEEGNPPQILISSKGKLKPAPTVGDVVIARVKPLHTHLYEGEALRHVTSAPNQMVGVFYEGKIVSVDRRFKEAFELDSSFPELKPNDLSLDKAKYDLNFTEVTTNGNTVNVTVLENNCSSPLPNAFFLVSISTNHFLCQVMICFSCSTCRIIFIDWFSMRWRFN